jgi:putative molybdopterin biosynthesis protein
MSIYLHDIPLTKAQARLQSALEDANLWQVLGIEEIPLDEKAFGRVLVDPVWARISSPHYHASAMDGFAVRALDTEGAMPTNPLTLTYDEQAIYIDTGDPLPFWANAVIPIENVEPLNEDGQSAVNARQPTSIRIRSAVTPWSHVRSMGEDMVATQLVLPAGHILRPVDLGAIAGCGHATVKVAHKPKVAILPTGTELKKIGEPVVSGDIIEYNTVVLAAQVNSWGGQATRWPITPDEFDAICSQVVEAAKSADLILLNAGSSAGSEDYSAQVVEALGELLVHGVAVRPGHPVILGMIRRPGTMNGESDGSVPIIGVPGYPVSAALTGEIFVEPLIGKWLGRPSIKPHEIEANLTRKIVSPSGDDDFLRVAVGRVGGKTLAAPISRGAGVITSLVQADGIVVIPRGSQGLPAGEKVRVRLYRSPEEIKRTILALGSHDICLDVIAQFMAARGRRLASANVGSLGGLVALSRGEAHLAGSHLLDPQSGEYNLSYINQYLPDEQVRVVALVGREQGLLVPRGNPKGIQTLSDLSNPDILFVNRQRGAGTRVLLDYQLEKLGLAPNEIRGYPQEEFTHLSVAVAVASGRADCGLGIAAAAHALDLDFIPLYKERYDLIVPKTFAESDLIAPLWAVLDDIEFKTMIAKLPGYDIGVMGKIIAELE